MFGRRGWGAFFAMGLLAATLLPRIVCAQTHYDGVDPYEEYGKRIHAAQEVSPLADTLFGNQVSPYNGATSFEVTDLSIPGNSALPVALSRELVIQDQRQVPAGGATLHGFGDWSIDVPYIWGTFTAQNGWTLYPSGATNRCSDNSDWPDMSEPIPGGSGYVGYEDIWNGDHLHIPGNGDQELLANTQSKSPADASARTYRWVTTGNWKVSCIGSVTGMTGEGFVAVSPAGVSYTFNYAVTRQTSLFAWQYNTKLAPMMVGRVNIYLLATHVQDRFGNWANYSYSNGQLTGIKSSDGRSITVNWSGNAISTVASALGTWTYTYGTDSNGYPQLASVKRPDGSKWTYTIQSGTLATTKNDWPDNEPLPATFCQTAPLQTPAALSTRSARRRGLPAPSHSITFVTTATWCQSAASTIRTSTKTTRCTLPTSSTTFR